MTTRVTTAARPRVAMIAGTLGPGGAEKQLEAMARALRARGVDVRVLSLTRGEWYEAPLRAAGIPVQWVGAHAPPPVRLLVMARALRPWRPHVVHAAHCFANLYAAALGRLLGAVDVGSVRSDGAYDVAGTGRWGPLLLDAPRAMLANSHAGAAALRARGRPGGAVHVLPNVVDLDAFDVATTGPLGEPVPPEPRGPVAIAVGTLAPVKAFDRFLDAVALARRAVPELEGWVVGDGPARARLEAHARDVGLDGAVHFLGRRRDVPALLRRAGVLVLTSRHEGLPNAVLEAMAAGLPVIATDVGDVRRLVHEGETGFVVPCEGAAVVPALAAHLVALAADPDGGRRLGAAGRQRVEHEHSDTGLADRLLGLYAAAAHRQGRPALAIGLAA